MKQPEPGHTPRHGRDCVKVSHEGMQGLLHSPEDDGPYDVDGVTYCGRCHSWIGVLVEAGQTPESDPAAEPMSAAEFINSYDKPLRIRDGVHKGQIIQFAKAFAAHTTQALRDTSLAIKDIPRRFADAYADLRTQVKTLSTRAETAESTVASLREALQDIIAEADQSNGGKGAQLPIVLHIRGIAEVALVASQEKK